MPGTMETPTRRPPIPAALTRTEVPPPSLPRSRRNHVTLGFWLGGVALGAVGCLVGAALPHRYAVGAAVSIIWWSIFLGCWGASLGALVGVWRKGKPPRASWRRHVGLQRLFRARSIPRGRLPPRRLSSGAAACDCVGSCVRETDSVRFSSAAGSMRPLPPR